MILKYKGFKQNWCYVEAPNFAVANLTLIAKPKEIETLTKIQEWHEYAEQAIREATATTAEYIAFLDGNDDALSRNAYSVAAVTFDNNCHEELCFVLFKEAYLMTDTGKTIERII